MGLLQEVFSFSSSISTSAAQVILNEWCNYELTQKTKVHSNLAIRNGLVRNKLVLRNHFLWPICHLLHKDKELLALNNFRATKKFLIAKFDCITKSSDSFTNLLSEFSINDFLRIFVMISIFFFNWQTEGKSLFWTFFLLFHNILSDHHYSDLINSLLNAFKLKKTFFGQIRFTFSTSQTEKKKSGTKFVWWVH